MILLNNNDDNDDGDDVTQCDSNKDDRAGLYSLKSLIMMRIMIIMMRGNNIKRNFEISIVIPPHHAPHVSLHKVCF